MVSGDLSDIVKTGEKFDYKSYVKDIYNLIKTNSPYDNAQDTEALALDYARQAATMVYEVAAIGRIEKEGKQVRLSVELKKAGFSSESLLDDIERFEDTEKGIDNVAAMVNPMAAVAESLKQAQVITDYLEEQKKEEELEEPKQEVVVQKPAPELQTGDKEAPQGSTRRNPLLRAYFALKRAIVNIFKERVDTGSTTIDYPGIGNIYVKLVSGAAINPGNRRAADQTVTNFDDNIYAAVVDSEGNFLYITDDGGLSKEGKAYAYFSAPKVEKQIADYLKSDKANFVTSNIINGSLGQFTGPQSERKLSAIKGINSSTKINPRDNNSKFPYYQIEGYPGFITISAPKFGDFNQKGNLEKILNLFVNKVYDKDEYGELKELSFDEKLERVAFMLNMKDKGGKTYKPIKFEIQNIFNSTTDQNREENKKKLEKILSQEYLNIDFPLFNANFYNDFELNMKDGNLMFVKSDNKLYKEDYLYQNFYSRGYFDSEGNPAVMDAYLVFQPQQSEVDKYTKAEPIIQPQVQVTQDLPGPDTKINIYAGTKENAELSNFAIRPFTVDIKRGGVGKVTFQSVEQAFQWMKGLYTNNYEIDPSVSLDQAQKLIDEANKRDQQIQDKILATTDGASLRSLGKSFKNFEAAEWDEKSSGVMKKLLLESFKQNSEALIKLLATGEATLTHTQDKSKWKTEFPKLLMQVRAELKSQQPEPIVVKPQEQTTVAPGPQEQGLSLDDIADIAMKDPESLSKLTGVKALNAKESVIKLAKGIIWYLGGKEALKHPAMKKFMSTLSRTEIEQIKQEALDNPNPSPIATKYKVPLEVVFKAVNSGARVDSANWSVNGIILNQYLREEGEVIDESISGDFSDIYHEAWHGFTQTWLTQAQRKTMYAEARKQKGTFTDYNGKRVSFDKADNLQLEEYLAEEFRTYMLSGGTYSRPEAPKTTSIFEWLVNLIKKLFGKAKTTSAELPTIQELYNNLRLGQLSQFNFDVNNRDKTIGQLAKSVEKLSTNKEDIDLNHQDSIKLINTIDSIISNIVDYTNNKSGTKRFTVGFFKKEDNMKAAYKYVKQQLETTIKKTLEEKLAKAEGAQKTYLQNQIDLVNYAIRNFGNTDNIKENRDGKGVIAYHQMKSKFISYEDRKNFFADINEEAVSTKGREGYGDRSGNELSQQELGDPDVHALLRSIYNFKGNEKVLNDFGVQELVPYDLMWNKLAKLLTGTVTPEKMQQTLLEAAKTDGTIAHLVEKLGNKDGAQFDEEFSLWTKFWQTFNGSLIPLVQMNVEETKIGDTDVTRYIVKIGRASSPYRQVGNRWSNVFEYLTSDEVDTFDKDPLTNQSYIDLKKLFKKFPTGVSIDQRMEFFRSLGIYFSADPKIKNAIEKNNVGGAEDIWRNLALLYQKHGVQRINALEDVFAAYPEKPSVDKNGVRTIAPALSSMENYFIKLQELEAINSDYTTNFLATNAEGNSQFEYSLNNTISIMNDVLNTAESFDAVLAHPFMEHFSEQLNSFTDSSNVLNSLFKMNEPGRKRRLDKDGKPIKINLSNLSGIQLIREDGSVGIASASADIFSKFIQDFHLMVASGRPENPRHADKSTSYSNYVDVVTPVGQSTSKTRLYIDLEDFAKSEGKAGKNRAYEIIKNYINSELNRIRKFKEIQSRVDKGEQVQFDFSYLKRGQDFVIFEDVLREDTKNLLLKADSSLNLKDILEINDGGIARMLREDFEKYFEKQVEIANGYYSKVDQFTADNLIMTIQRENKVTIAEAKKAAMQTFVYNSWIHNMEAVIMIYGDIAQYKEADDFTKRIAGAGSTGKIMRADVSAITYVNNKKNLYAMKRLGATVGEDVINDRNAIGLNGTLNSAIMEDNEIGTEYIGQLREAIKEDIERRFEGKKTKKEIKDLVETELGDYVKSMKEGDAQGWITFDAYRALSRLEGKWRPEHEKMYMDIINGKKIDYETIKYFFPVRKFQYWGSVKNDFAAANAFHKFSLMPLIPSLVEGTNLDDLHLKFMNEGIHYGTFKTGSKIATITTNGVADKFYTNSKERTIVNMDDKPFTKNTVYLQYLKDQLDIADEFKGKATFPTQMRKLIESGLMEGGVPVDFKPGKSLEARVKLWATVVDKEAESPIYKAVKTYEENIEALTTKLMNDLIKEASIEFDKDGNIIFNDNLADFMVNALRSEELAEHEIDFLRKAPGGKSMAHDLSLSLSSEKIEKALNSIVVKRLVRQQFNGEGLIQVSGAGFESKTPKFREATDEEKLKYKGTNDLPFYRRSGGKDGKTSAAKIKIALQGDFIKLLNLKHPDGEKIGTIERLNDLIKDDNWLDQGNNRRMITITGARIPVQGLNSMEFMEVYEFLDSRAGNIIILPSEIVAKSGSDFDIDKLTMMMPNIEADYNFKKWSTKEGKKLLETLAKENPELAERLTPDNVGIVLDIFKNNEEVAKLDELDKRVLDILKTNSEMNIRMSSGNTVKGLQNAVIQSMIDILEMPNNYLSLVKPNSTHIAKGLADSLASRVLDYDNNYRIHGEKTGKAAGTRALEIGFNLYKHSSHNIGKETLGLGAVDNTYNSVFNRIGMYLNPTFTAGYGDEKFERRATILLNHNKLNGGISLSHIMDANNQYYIGDIISQLINGWVDVAKDPWIFNIQGNKEAAPTLLFMVQAGVPFEQAVHLMSQPIIREYIQEQKKAKSTFARPLGEDIENPNFFRGYTRDKFVKQYLLKSQADIDTFDELENTKNFLGKQEFIYNKTLEYTRNPEFLGFISDPTNLEKNISSKQKTDNDIATLLHFFELEDMAKTVRDVKLRTNFDTTRSSSSYDAEEKISLAEDLASNDLIPSDLLDRILQDTPIGSFYVQPFQIKAWKGFFELRNNDKVNEFLKRYIKENKGTIYRMFGDTNEFVKAFKNALPSFVFQNELKTFDINRPSTFDGLTINTAAGPATIKTAMKLKEGIVVKKVGDQNIIYIDKQVLKKNYIAFMEGFNNPKPESKQAKITAGEAYVDSAAFTGKPSDDYYRFAIAREVLKSTHSKEQIAQREDYKDQLKLNMKNQNYTLVGESAEAYTERIKNLTYEEIIRDMALDNTFNSWKMFNSSSSVADQFFDIIKKHPSLLDNYAVIQNFKKSESKDKRFKNLVFTDTDFTADKLNIFNENLEELSNSSKIRLDVSDQEKARVAEFFRRLSTYAFLQSGLNTSSPFSIVRAVPQRPYLDKMIPAAAWFTNELESASPEQSYNMLKTFGQMLIRNHSNYRTKNRFSDYHVANYRSIKKVADIETIIPTGEDNSGNFIYATKLRDDKGRLNKPYTSEEAANLMNTHSNVAFIAEMPFELQPNERDQNPLYVAFNTRGMTNFIPVVTRNTADRNGGFTDQLSEKEGLSGKIIPQASPKKVGFDIKEISLNTKDPKKAAIATDIIEFGRTDSKTGRVSSSQKYGEAAVNQGISRNSGVYDSGTVAMVSVSGNNVATTEDINNTVEQIIKVLNAGGSVIMDNEKNRNSRWNASGEGAVFDAVIAAIGAKNLANVSKDPDYIRIKYKSTIPMTINGLVEPNSKVKESIDNFIEKAKELKKTGMQLGFPQSGIAQYMREGNALARQTFLYLSKRLLEVGYVNPGLLEIQSDPDNQIDKGGIEIVEMSQQVSYREASDKLLECFGKR
jgi:hypothetical protein